MRIFLSHASLEQRPGTRVTPGVAVTADNAATTGFGVPSQQMPSQSQAHFSNSSGVFTRPDGQGHLDALFVSEMSHDQNQNVLNKTCSATARSIESDTATTDPSAVNITTDNPVPEHPAAGKNSSSLHPPILNSNIYSSLMPASTSCTNPSLPTNTSLPTPNPSTDNCSSPFINPSDSFEFNPATTSQIQAVVPTKPTDCSLSPCPLVVDLTSSQFVDGSVGSSLGLQNTVSCPITSATPEDKGYDSKPEGNSYGHKVEFYKSKSVEYRKYDTKPDHNNGYESKPKRIDFGRKSAPTGY
ncbi:hypothetical protein Pint_21606 [Pistacia integerrima]|uniref:Uncharacterized protein n=1 Tax=Pistacia integerrima TaxID=434235 RepID=A0ACC0XAM9_9ROSI|nr:hypothetical protein Pint_21606 [Pistacia integerrima]